jgi:hypothetical protein
MAKLEFQFIGYSEIEGILAEGMAVLPEAEKAIKLNEAIKKIRILAAINHLRTSTFNWFIFQIKKLEHLFCDTFTISGQFFKSAADDPEIYGQTVLGFHQIEVKDIGFLRHLAAFQLRKKFIGKTTFVPKVE